MAWQIIFHREFGFEFDELSLAVQKELTATLTLLRTNGPMLKRPFADTLKGSKFPNMKELRFHAEDGVWRVAFAFDQRRKAIVLVAGNKAGVTQDRFYKRLIAKADARFSDHLRKVKE